MAAKLLPPDRKKAAPTQLRLDPIKLRQYEEEAAIKHMRLTDYLRDRLDRADLADGMTALADALSAQSHPSRRQPIAGAGPAERAVMLEILLLLRLDRNPQQQRAAHSELERQGLTPFNFTEVADAPRR